MADDRNRDQNQDQGQRNQKDVVLDTIWGALHPQISPALERLYDRIAESPFGDQVFHYYLGHKGIVKAGTSGLGMLLNRYQDPSSPFWTHATDLLADSLGEALVRLDQRSERHGGAGVHAADIIVAAAHQAASLFQRIIMLQDPQRTELVNWLLLSLDYEHQQIAVKLVASLDDAALRRFAKMTDEQKRNTVSLFAQEELHRMQQPVESSAFEQWFKADNARLQERLDSGFFGRRRGRN